MGLWAIINAIDCEPIWLTYTHIYHIHRTNQPFNRPTNQPNNYDDDDHVYVVVGQHIDITSKQFFFIILFLLRSEDEKKNKEKKDNYNRLAKNKIRNTHTFIYRITCDIP